MFSGPSATNTATPMKTEELVQKRGYIAQVYKNGVYNKTWSKKPFY